MSWLCLERKLVLPPDGVPRFVPLVVEPITAPDPVAARTDAGVVKIEIAGAVLPVASDCSPERAACGVRLQPGTCGGAKEGFVIFPDQAIRIVIATKRPLAHASMRCRAAGGPPQRSRWAARKVCRCVCIDMVQPPLVVCTQTTAGPWAQASVSGPTSVRRDSRSSATHMFSCARGGTIRLRMPAATAMAVSSKPLRWPS